MSKPPNILIFSIKQLFNGLSRKQDGGSVEIKVTKMKASRYATGMWLEFENELSLCGFRDRDNSDAPERADATCLFILAASHNDLIPVLHICHFRTAAMPASGRVSYQLI